MMMRNKNIVFLLKVVMVFGILLSVTGVFLSVYEPRIWVIGVVGIFISSRFVAVGMILSLQTKIFITFSLMKRRADMADQKAKHP
jgi:hypothetical protein